MNSKAYTRIRKRAKKKSEAERKPRLTSKKAQRSREAAASKRAREKAKKTSSRPARKPVRKLVKKSTSSKRSLAVKKAWATRRRNEREAERKREEQRAARKLARKRRQREEQKRELAKQEKAQKKREKKERADRAKAGWERRKKREREKPPPGLPPAPPAPPSPPAVETGEEARERIRSQWEVILDDLKERGDLPSVPPEKRQIDSHHRNGFARTIRFDLDMDEPGAEAEVLFQIDRVSLEIEDEAAGFVGLWDAMFTFVAYGAKIFPYTVRSQKTDILELKEVQPDAQMRTGSWNRREGMLEDAELTLAKIMADAMIVRMLFVTITLMAPKTIEEEAAWEKAHEIGPSKKSGKRGKD